MYREQTVSPWFGALLIAGVFLLVYAGWVLYPRELFRQESVYAVQALEFNLKNPLVTMHGTPVRNAYPVFPAVCSLLYNSLGLPMELVLRFVTVFFIAAGSVLVYFSAALGGEKRSGLVGAAFYCTTALMLDKGVTGAPQTMSAFWLLAAQMSFFYFGLRRGKWNLAWLLCVFLLMLGFFTDGLLVLFCFVVPLFLLRRLIAGRAKYRNWGFPAALVIVFLSLVARFTIQWNLERTTGGTLFFRGFTHPDYLGDFLLYFLRLPLLLFPWSVIAWLPFCVALQQLDSKPLFSKYLRINVLVTVFLLWLIPKTDGREMFYLLGPLAILTGLYYDLGMRRFGERLRKLAPLAEYGALLTVLLLAVGMWGNAQLLSKCFSLGLTLKFRASQETLAAVLFAITAVLITGFLLRWMRNRRPVWIVLLSFSLMGGMFYSTLMLRYRAQENRAATFGRQIRETLQADQKEPGKLPELYKTGVGDLYGELFYSGARIIQLPSADLLPDDRTDTVYLLSSAFPQNPKWSWQNLLPENFSFQGKRIMLWRGKRNFQEKFPPQ